MAEYHIGCGFAGIYAGTLNPKTKGGYQTWRNKSDVTEEAVAAVAQYFDQELRRNNETEMTKKYISGGGAIVELTVSRIKEGDEE